MNTLTWTIPLWFALLSPLEPPSPAPGKADQIPQQSSTHPKGKAAAYRKTAKPKPVPVDQNKAKPDDGPHDSEAEAKDAQSTADWWIEFLTARNAIITLLFTFVLTMVTAGQWWLMRETIKQAHAAQRAWVGYIDLQLEPPDVGRQLNCTAIVKNTGNTPGIIRAEKSWHIVCPPSEIEKHIKDIDRAFKKLPPQENAIPPGGTLQFIGESPLRFDEEMMSDINSGARIFLIVCRVTYVDIVGKRHQSRACCEYNPAVKKYRGYRKYNHMD